MAPHGGTKPRGMRFSLLRARFRLKKNPFRGILFFSGKNSFSI
jgi:hypothetical protein